MSQTVPDAGFLPSRGNERNRHGCLTPTPVREYISCRLPTMCKLGITPVMAGSAKALRSDLFNPLLQVGGFVSLTKQS